MKTTPFQYLVQYLEKLQGYAIAENGYRRVMMDNFVGKAQEYVAQLEAKNERLRHLAKEGLEWSDENIDNYLEEALGGE